MMESSVSLHGVYMDIFGVGVFLTGASGMGKSEIALGLISRGHRLVADDSAEFYLRTEHNSSEVIGKCHEILKNFLEVRGLGILNIKEMFGENSIKDHVALQLVIYLTDLSDDEIRNSDRLHGMHSKITLLGKDIARVVVPVAAGRNLSVLIETAVRNHRLRIHGYDAAKDFINRQHDFLESRQ